MILQALLLTSWFEIIKDYKNCFHLVFSLAMIVFGLSKQISIQNLLFIFMQSQYAVKIKWPPNWSFRERLWGSYFILSNNPFRLEVKVRFSWSCVQNKSPKKQVLSQCKLHWIARNQYFSCKLLLVIYSKIYTSMVLARRESRLSRREWRDSRLERRDSHLARNETRGGKLLLSGTVETWFLTNQLADFFRTVL